MSSSHWKNVAGSWLLLSVVLLVAGGLLALIGSTVIPEAGMFVWASVGLLLFVGVQLLMFRAFGLRSRADEPRDAGALPSDADEPGLGTDGEPGAPASSEQAREASGEPTTAAKDWRAWRG